LPKFSYTLSRYAESDLASIFDFTLETWGEEQLHRYRALLEEALDKICRDPMSQRSKPRDELFKDCRSVYAGRHVILYRVKEKSVEIARVLHQSMELDRHIPPEWQEE
jgi:toxin ParE1/3/4